MDANRFDRLVQSLSTTPRRGLMQFLASLSLLGGLTALLGENEAAADGRRRRRKKRHKHGKGRHRGGRKKCKAKSRAKTCAGKCGTAKDKCKKKVDCGSCACEPPCLVCQVCNATTLTCEADPAQQGQPCGQAGEICFDGDCVCDGDVCASGCPVSSLQQAINAAQNGATIRLCAETYPGTITINKDLTLIGVGDGEDGTILDGQQNDSVVIVTSGVIVELEGLRITGGSDDDGGGIDNIGSSVTLTDSSVTGNVAADFGGGIRNSDGTVTLNGTSSVNGNRVTDGDGGGIYNFLFGTVTLNNDSSVMENTPDNCAGSGTYSGNECGP